jgi:hypothetical protein
MTLVFKQMKTVHALDCMANVIVCEYQMVGNKMIMVQFEIMSWHLHGGIEGSQSRSVGMVNVMCEMCVHRQGGLGSISPPTLLDLSNYLPSSLSL